MPMPDARRGALVLGVLASLLVASPLAGRVSAQLEDFDLERPSLGEGLLDRGSLDGAPTGTATFEARLESEDPKPGGEAVLIVTVKLPNGFYIPSMDAKNPKPTEIGLAKLVGLEPVDGEWRADHAPKVAMEKSPVSGELEEVEKFFDAVTWSRRFRIVDGAPVTVSADLVVDGQYCSTRECKLILGKKVSAELALAGAEPAPPVPATRTMPFVHEETPRPSDQPYPAGVRVELAPTDAPAGDEIVLSVKMTIEDEYYTFSTTMVPGLGGSPTKITVGETYGLEPVDADFQPSRPSIEKTVDLGLDEPVEQEIFENEITWQRRYRVTGDAGYGVAGSIKYAVCTKSHCKQPVTVAFALGALPGAAVPVRGGPEREAPAVPGDAAAAPGIEPSSEEEDAATGETVSTRDDPRAEGLLWFLVAAAGAGFLALLTPCVFPMVPITVSFFLKQSEKEHTKPLALAIVYALGIMATFTVLGLAMAAIFGATGINQLATNPWLNLAIAGVLVFFALNLLGMFEIRMPSWLVNWSSGHQGQGGYMGALFMALTFTLMSFTCTFAFAGGLLVWAANGEYFWPILGMLAFSAAFSLPFFLLALFPSWLKQLPKSGGWMNTVKVTMGLLELGAAFKFLNAFLPLVFDYSLVMCAWLVLAICTGLYLLGVYRLPHDMPVEGISVPRFGFAVFFLGLATYLAHGLYGLEEPKGVLWDQIAAFAPPRVQGGQSPEIGPIREDHGIQYALDVDRAIEYARAKNKPLVFDFTGYQCANCRLMERLTHRPENRELLNEYVLVALYQDQWPPEIPLDAADQERIIARNRKLASEWLGDVSLPSYAIVRPNGELVADVRPLIGYENDAARITTFLADGVRAWERIAREETATRVAVRR